MAIAGKVAITPKGEWNSVLTYEKLDAVSHNNCLYIAKKASSGIIPEDGDVWMLATKSIDMDEFSKIIDGTTIVGEATKATQDGNGNNIVNTYQTKTGDSKDNTVSFTSADSTSPTAWTDVAALASGEKHSSLFNKISTMFKNVRFLYKMLGTTDISSIGNGTVTGGLSALNSNLDGLEYNEVAGGKNLFDISKIDLINVEYKNGVYTNKITDSKTFFYAYIDYWNDDGYIGSYTNESFEAYAKGRYSITGKIIEGCTKIRFKHNGTTNDITFFIIPISYFGLEVGDIFTISMDVDGYNTSTVGGIIVKNIQIEKGSSATPYEPYIPSVKMLAEEVSEQNESLADYGIDNVATTFYQGWYTDPGVQNTVRTDLLNCSAEDIVSVKCENTFVTIYAVFYDGSKNQLSIANASNTKELSVIVPNNSAYCIVNVVDNKDISPSTIGKVSVYVNNEIYKLKNDLKDVRFYVENEDFIIEHQNGDNISRFIMRSNGTIDAQTLYNGTWKETQLLSR